MHTTDTRSNLIDTYADAGLLPADEFGGPGHWLHRYDAVAPVAGPGFVVARETDDEVYLAVLTSSGVIRTETRFGLDDLSLAMFAGAVAAVMAVDA